MSTVEKRVDALEQAAKLLDAQSKVSASSLSLEDLQCMIKDVLTRASPKLSQEEQLAKFRAGIERMNANWAARHGG